MMSKPIIINKSQWEVLYNRFKQDYPLSTVLVRRRMREVLGFVPREHSEWIPKMSGGYHLITMRLDFYDEKKRIMFLLKYGDVIHERAEFE